MRPPLFWDVKQCRLVIADVSGQSIGSIFKGQAVIILEDGADRFRETSVINYQSTLRNIPEEQRPQLGDQLNSTRFLITFFKFCFPTAYLHVGLSDRETKFCTHTIVTKS
jgi:hypothetical protein